MEHHLISAQHLSIDRIREILFRRLPLALSDDARARIVRCREYLDRKMENPERPVYGITTGFGSLCDISVGYEIFEPNKAATSKNISSYFSSQNFFITSFRIGYNPTSILCLATRKAAIATISDAKEIAIVTIVFNVSIMRISPPQSYLPLRLCRRLKCDAVLLSKK